MSYSVANLKSKAVDIGGGLKSIYKMSRLKKRRKNRIWQKCYIEPKHKLQITRSFQSAWGKIKWLESIFKLLVLMSPY